MMNMSNNMLEMFIISLLAGVFSTMNVWAVKWSHVRFHINDLYMVVLMACWMLLLTELYTAKWFTQTSILAMALIAITIYCIRNQVLVDDKQFLKGMITHHSMAIQMAQNIQNKTNNQKIKTLANDIIIAQTREIKEMNELLESI